MTRKIFLIAMLTSIFILFSASIFKSEKYLNDFSKSYYLSNGFYETGSKNIVTGIYLDYRLFDSIFEASILLIVVSGIIFISTRDDKIL
ncbi:MAG: hypothetical protein MJA82_04705 [Clostridia bacterium]|nr:hypothetical protein [Clostridia bacterium]